MGKKLSEDKLKFIKKRLCQNVPISDIAEELQISERTVLRYKKRIPMSSAPNDNGDSSIKINYTTLLTKKEEVFAKKVANDLMLFDDPTEGWVWHLDKGDFRLKTSGFWWSAIVYPESAPEFWIQKLRNKGYRIAISPLHDKDVWNHDSPEMVDPETGEIMPKGSIYKAGDGKKAHWHVIIVCDQRVNYKEINAEIQNICHCPYIQKCRSLKNAYAYFLHANAPEKYQGYMKEEIQVFNDFHIEPTKYEQNIIATEMVKLIQEYDISEWADCVEFFCEDPEFSLILSTRAAYFNAYIKSRYFKSNPNNVKYTEIKTVDKFSFEEHNEK